MGERISAAERLKLADLPQGVARSFTWQPDAQVRAEIAAQLGIRGLRKLRLAGALEPQGERDWRLEAMLGATVVQDCVVTLDPVTTRIDEPVTRVYLADPPPEPEGEEVEMPEDDTLEPLPEVVDLRAVAVEALALALPPYPRAEGVEPLEQSFAAPGTEPLTEETIRPFAGLAALRDRLRDGGETDEDD